MYDPAPGTYYIIVSPNTNLNDDVIYATYTLK